MDNIFFSASNLNFFLVIYLVENITVNKYFVEKITLNVIVKIIRSVFIS